MFLCPSNFVINTFMIHKYQLDGFFHIKSSIFFFQTNTPTDSHPISIQKYIWKLLLHLWSRFTLCIYHYTPEMETNVFVQFCSCWRSSRLIIKKARSEGLGGVFLFVLVWAFFVCLFLVWFFFLIFTVLTQQDNALHWLRPWMSPDTSQWNSDVCSFTGSCDT